MSGNLEFDTDQFAAARLGGGGVAVREGAEYVALVLMSQLANRMGELSHATPVYVNCVSANRSKAMTDQLRVVGFDAWSVVGGTNAGARSGRPAGGELR